MICSKCNKEINDNISFCNFCGNKLNNQINPQKTNFSKGQKITIISLLCVVILMLSIVVLSPNNSFEDSRTVMIYVVGSNLETNAGIVSTDLAAIDPKSIDLKTTNILLYTGGTEIWHNFIDNKDNGIYILKPNGFQKLESQEQFNLGDPNTLTNFLKYGYENYNTEKYDLILYNHGGAIDGAIYDDISGDNLSLEDMKQALKNSPFNKNNKLETVLFRTCLNGTIELANIFNDYANYLIASEEVSYGSGYTDVLGFLNDVKNKDNGLEYGIKYVEAYEEQMEILNPLNTITQTYSVIDMSQIDEINKELDEYISSINLTENYNEISKIRANIYQYGTDATNYDMIDLYEFIVQTEAYATKDNDKLLKLLNEAIVYNKTNESGSHGISIYFPYRGTQGIKNKFLSVYENLNYSEEYKKFIKKFNTIQTSPSEYKFDITKNEIGLDDTNNEITIQLTQEQKENYTGATFTIFERDAEHPNYYKPLFNTNKVTLDDNGLLKANFKNMLVKIESDGKYEYMLTYYRTNNNSRSAIGTLYDKDLEFTDKGYVSSATLYLTNNDQGDPILSNAKLISDNERIDGIILNLKEYETIELWQYTYRILDEKGNVLKQEEWETAPVVYGYESELSEIKMKYSNLDNGNNYYALFIITDINGNRTYSKLIKIGE